MHQMLAMPKGAYMDDDEKVQQVVRKHDSTHPYRRQERRERAIREAEEAEERAQRERESQRQAEIHHQPIDENIPGNLPAVVIWRIVLAIVMLALVLF
jgi:hypothetical protein